MYLGATELRLPNGIGPYGASTRPLTLGQVGSIVAQVSAELDAAAAAAGYSVPIPTTATGGYAQMQGYTQAGAAWLVLRDVFPNVTGTADRMSLASEYRDSYKAALKMIREGTQPLIGAAFDTGSTGRQLPRSRGSASPNVRICTVF